jgi:two-component system, LuxR family, response regulator FixJ
VPRGHSISVLVGDADEASCRKIAMVIAQLGYQTETFPTGAKVLAAARGTAPPLVILDSDLSNPTAYEVCRELRKEQGQSLPIVFVSGTRTEMRDQVAAMLLGADDYFPKPLGDERFAARLGRLLARSVRPARISLTPREVEVLELMVEGRRPAEIAELLCITPKTASTHIEHILSKLGAHSQAQAVAFALRENIVPRSASAS